LLLCAGADAKHVQYSAQNHLLSSLHSSFREATGLTSGLEEL
jgi:hypothetical protein